MTMDDKVKLFEAALWAILERTEGFNDNMVYDIIGIVNRALVGAARNG